MFLLQPVVAGDPWGNSIMLSTPTFSQRTRGLFAPAAPLPFREGRVAVHLVTIGWTNLPANVVNGC
jgi:hypothetical protein